MSVEYSPLCEVSERAYLAYCLAKYGASFGGHYSFVGRKDGEGCSGGSVDFDGGVGSGDSRGVGPWQAWMAVVGGVGVGGNALCDGGSSSSTGSDGGSRVGGVAGFLSGGCQCGNVDSSGDAPGGADFGDAVGVSDAEVESAPVLVRGKNYRKNKARRARRARDRLDCSSGFVSSFADCDRDRVKELRESRLAALTEENNWRAHQFRAKWTSTAVYSDYDRVRTEYRKLSLEDKLLKLAEKRGVAGWAKTVVSDTSSVRERTQEAWEAASGSVAPSSSASQKSIGVSIDDISDRLSRIEDIFYK